MQKTYSSDLTASQWQAIEKRIEVKRKSVHSLQLVVEAIFYLSKNGCTWRDLPEGFPPWQTVYGYCHKWNRNGTWELIANELTLLHRQKIGKKPLPTVGIIDAQSVKNSATATAHIGFDGGKLIKGRKRFLIVDTMGHVLWTQVCPANVADGKAGVACWQEAQLLNPLLDDFALMDADKTFGGHFKQQLETLYAMRVEIPKEPVAEQAPESKLVIHKWRWIVERTISWLANNRRLARDYERTLRSARSFIWIAHIRRTINCVFQ